MRIGVRARRRTILAGVLIVLVCTMAGAFPTNVTGQADSLAHARELYAAAGYREALAMVERLGPAAASLSAEVGRDLEMMRALCLAALGQDEEARASMGRLVELDPQFGFAESDASPRVRQAYAEVRAARLPEVVRARFVAARQAFLAGDYRVSRDGFTVVRALLDDPALDTNREFSAASDYRLLTDGFLDLSTRLLAAATPAQRQPPAPSAFVAAQPIAEPVPPWLPGHYGTEPAYVARLEVAITSSGAVSGVRVVESNNPRYDSYLVQAAKGWRYRPATENGAPVSSLRTVPVRVEPQG